MIQHPGKSTLKEKGLILALDSMGIQSIVVEKTAAGRESMAAGSWLVTHTCPQMRGMRRSRVEPGTVTLKPSQTF